MDIGEDLLRLSWQMDIEREQHRFPNGPIPTQKLVTRTGAFWGLFGWGRNRKSKAGKGV
jgi:hypothetical protein